MATQGHVRESESRLQKEIEVVRKEIRELEGRLRKEIEQVRLAIKSLEVRLTQAIHRTLSVVGDVGAIVGLMRFLDAVLK